MQQDQEDKIKSIECSPAKTTIRGEITDQTLQWINNANIEELEGVSLPALGYFHEKNLIDRVVNNFGRLKNIPSIHFNCAEMDKQTLHQGLKHRSPNTNITYGTIEDLISKPIKFTKRGVGKISQDGQIIPEYNWLWADYCGHPSKEIIDNLVDKISLKKNLEGLYYVTHSLARKKHLQIIKELGYAGKYAKKDVQKAVQNYILKTFKKLNKKAKLIYSVRYSGGGGKTTMVTVGVLIGNAKVDVLIKDSQADNKPQQKINYATFNGIKKWSKIWSTKPEKEKVAKKNASDISDKDRAKIAKKYVKWSLGIKLFAPYMSEFVFENRLSVHQVAGVVSWLTSPKLKAKAKN